MADDILAAEKQEDDNYVETDVFNWANNLVPIKEELKIELFLINKNYVVYRTKLGGGLTKQLQPLLIDGLLDEVLEGAGQGMVVRGFEEGESQENVLQRTRVKNVQKAREVISWLKTQEHEIETFNEAEHDMKRIKGIIARVTHDELDWPFYVCKTLPGSNVMKGSTAWLMRNGSFVPFDAEGALRIPPENQLLILDQDIYVFNQAKLDQLFGYNAKKYGIAQKKLEEIGKNFTFNFDEGVSLEALVEGKKALINKLQNLETEGITQEELMNHAEEMGLNLMTDTNGSIIIMDGKDLSTFINLLNEDYMESPVTGKKYEIKSKKLLKVTEEAFGEEVK